MKKLLSCLLALACVLSMSVPAFAAEPDIEIIDVNPENIVLVEEVIGSLNDQDGILLDDEPVATPRSTRVLFTMTATKVYELLTTYGANKNFTGGVMDGLAGEGLLITGTVTNHQPNVVEGAATVKVGACYYQPSTNTFVSVAHSYFPSGTAWRYWAPKIYFSNQMTYYGHITNNFGVSYVSGSLTFSVSTNPEA